MASLAQSGNERLNVGSNHGAAERFTRVPTAGVTMKVDLFILLVDGRAHGEARGESLARADVVTQRYRLLMHVRQDAVQRLGLHRFLSLLRFEVTDGLLVELLFLVLVVDALLRHRALGLNDLVMLERRLVRHDAC